MRRFAAVLAVCLIGLAGLASAPVLSWSVAQAQEKDSIPDYKEWEVFAEQAEFIFDTYDGKIAELVKLRAELDVWRGDFAKTQSINSSRISILRDQISTLGPAPTEDETEPDEITQRRTELNVQLAELEAPQLKAVEAFQHANGLIGQVDNLIRGLEARRLLELGPSPLNPTHWATALRELGASLAAIGSEVDDAWNTPEKRSVFVTNLPISGFYLLVAIVLLARGRRWMERLTAHVSTRSKEDRYAELKAFFVSLGQVLVPVLGLLLLSWALSATELFGVHGNIVISDLPILGLAGFGARWLALRLFPIDRRQENVLGLDLAKRTELRFYSSLLGPLFGLSLLLSGLAEYDEYTIASRAVLAFPVLCLVGLILFRLGTIFANTLARTRKSGQQFDETDVDSPVDLRATLGAFLGRVMIVAGVGGLLAGAIGFSVAAIYFILPTVKSVALIGLLLVLHSVSLEAYRAITRKSDEEANQALLPVLINLVLVVLSLPLFALFWGAHVSDLVETWQSFIAGFTFAGISISPVSVLKLTVVFAIGYGLTRLLQTGLRTAVLPKTKIDTGGRTALLAGTGYLGIFLSAVLAITSAGIDLSSVAIVAGALSVGIGFGLQTVVSNFVSGIILLIERPIAEGDWIEVGGQSGIVRDISVRATRIETFDRTDVIVPNADLVSGVVTNWTRGNLIGRVRVPVGVAYGTDTRKVEKILKEVAEDHPLVAMNPPPAVLFMEFGADSLNFEIRAILRDVNFILVTRSEMNHAIAKRFAEEGIEIPFAQRDIWLRNPEVLGGHPAGPAAATDDAPTQDDEEPET